MFRMFAKIVAGLVAARLFTVEGDRHYHGVCPTDGALKRTGTLTGKGVPRCPDHNTETPEGTKPEELTNVFQHEEGSGEALTFPGGKKMADSKVPEGADNAAVPPGGAAPAPAPSPEFGAYDTQLRQAVREELRAELDVRETSKSAKKLDVAAVVSFVGGASAEDLTAIDEAVTQRLEEVTKSAEKKPAAAGAKS